MVTGNTGYGPTSGANGQIGDLLDAAGFDIGGAFSPAQQFRQYATQYTQPGLMRNALYGMQPQMLQRYMLNLPTGVPTAPGAPTGALPFERGGSFQDFMGAYGSDSYSPMGFGFTGGEASSGRRLAESIAALGSMTGAQFGSYMQPDAGTVNPYAAAFTGTNLTPQQQYFYRQQYGTGQDAEENRRQLAGLLEQQRMGATPGGLLSQAVTGGLNELYENLLARDPTANFLNWYLSRTRPAETTGTGT